jgi:hypothetical protein
MISRAAAPRWAHWVLAFALLLKAAVPLLAAVSAQAQGRALVEVCTVYGVATVDPGRDPVPDDAPATAHGSTPCALGAVVALEAPPAVAAGQASPLRGGPVLHAGRVVAHGPHDAMAAWAARLHHAPPAA